jgi:hypothetical protein
MVILLAEKKKMKKIDIGKNGKKAILKKEKGETLNQL